VIGIVERARAAGWRIVLGGPEPANYAEEYLAVGADYVVQGEGELPLEQLLSGNPAPDGVIYRNSSGYRDSSGPVIRTPAAALIPNLDSLPWPDRERIDLGRYLAAWKQPTAPAPFP